MPKAYVIDDSMSVCFAIERMLNAQGFVVVTERSGEAALAHVERERPDLVICDLVLPEIDGTEICRYVCQHPQLRHTPVIMISGILDDEIEEKVMAAGACRVLKKPFEPGDLLQCVAACLPETAAEAPPSRPQIGRLQDVLAELSNLAALRFAVVVQADGTLLNTFGTPLVLPPDLSEEVGQVTRVAARLLGQLKLGELRGVIVESSLGNLLAQPLGDEFCLVVALQDAMSLGKARYLLRKMRQPLLEALDSVTANVV